MSARVREVVGKGGFEEPTRDWISRLEGTMRIKKAIPAELQIFQDELLQLAVGKDAESSFNQLEKDVFRGELSIVLSWKEEANKEFSTKFEFIGVRFDTSDLNQILRRPTNKIMIRINRDCTELFSRQQGILFKRKSRQLIGRLKFSARFVEHGNTRLNSS